VLDAARAAAPVAPGERAAYWGQQIGAACQAANAEAVQAAAEMERGGNPPSCTFVAAVLQEGVIVAGWAGDSRAYWLPDGGPGVQLSLDDSWASEQMALGIPREQAEADHRAHAITRWLGADSPVTEPRLSSLTTDGRAGWLLVCSDGLWNYCSPADDLRTLVDGSTTGPEVPPVAAALVAWANAQGGHDNITVALARVPAGGASSSAAADALAATVLDPGGDPTVETVAPAPVPDGGNG
jgi:serine/threonine protein phosphatase PrpC